MLARVEIENKDGATLLKYNNPKERIPNGSPTFSFSEKNNGIVYKGYFLLADDQYMAKEVLSALIKNLAIETEEFIHKKHAILCSYIDNYLTTRNPVFSIPRRNKAIDPLHLNTLLKKKVYVEVHDKIFQRVNQGQAASAAYGEVSVKPSDVIGQMSMRIDSRSLCGIKSITYHPLISTKKEGFTTFLTCPSKKMVLMNHYFKCNDSLLPLIKLVLIDAKTIEVLLSIDEERVPEEFKASLCFDSNPGNIQVECKGVSHTYAPNTHILSLSLSPKKSESITIHCTEAHRGNMLLNYSYVLNKYAASNLIVTGLASEADENWIKYTTSVSGLLRSSE
ncbi:hypothetical protein NEFER03_0140 [Nematocida sp. LUAm3]|nr:hypothetical protein NEFER03_0140 [Nematocida sp. LUAm3]KAI5173593.1 hypothetical protein NEFER02_0109 [Nematocida sp. LUAm2]KAI5176814.1 hypothetical protein NEFER01_0139 [Nematocida sp. LUAm1]